MADPMRDFRAAILAALPGAELPDTIEPGRLHRYPTSGRRRDDAGWCKLFNDMRAGVFGDFRAGLSETWRAAERREMTGGERAALARQVLAATTERQALQRRAWADNARRIARTLSECVPMSRGDAVSLYLKRRGLADVWPQPQVLRLHPALPYWHGADKLGTFPAMVAPIVAPGGRIVALHRTYLTADGRKADVPSPKKLTAAAGPLAGACIPLSKPKRGLIGIAEGVETALAAHCASGVPAVAAYCARNLAAWCWPGGVQRLVIFADHDKAGREAAHALRERAMRAGVSVNVMTPTDEGADWADVWAGRDAVLIESEGAA